MSDTNGLHTWLESGNGTRLIALCTIWTGVMAGFFWAFTVVVMRGLQGAETEPAAAMSAMQGINNSVQSVQFAIFFFGAPILCLLAIGQGIILRDNPWRLIDAAAGLVYIVGVLLVTFTQNIPLNDDLDKLDASNPADAALMGQWINDWSMWNDVRTISGIVAVVLFTISLVRRATR